MDPLKLFIPLTKVIEEQRLVYGVLAEEALDKTNEIFDYASSKPLFQEWSNSFAKATAATGQELSLGNLRAMHKNVAAGKFTEIVFNDEAKRIEVCAKVVDDQEWAKVQQGVYTGFSVGGSYAKTWQDTELKKKRYTAAPTEGSLADNPCMYGATFTMVKSAGGEELRKFVGEQPPADPPAEPLAKDAVAAVDAGNAAIAALKTLAIELLSMPGEPDTWSLDNILMAIRGAITGKITAEVAAQEEGKVAAGAGPEQPNGDTAAAAEKTAATEIAKVADPAGVQKIAPSAPAEDLRKFMETATAALEDLKKVNGELKATNISLEERLKKIESLPAPVGRPVKKQIGLGAGAAGSEATDAVEKVIKAAEAEGLPRQSVEKIRIEAATEMMKNL